MAGDRLGPGRHRSLAAAVERSYLLLDDHERRVFRQLLVFPGPFTLEAAEAVGGPGAGPAVLRLVDCSLLSPPRAGPDGWSRYGMLETLRAYGAGLLAGAGEQDGAAAALAGWALGVAEEAAAGLGTSEGELAAARRLDAEDAAMRQVLAWALDHDAAMAVRLAVTLAPWWQLRGRLTGQYPLLRQAAGSADAGSDRWCAAQIWLGHAAVTSADMAAALGHFTAVRDAIGDRGPSRALADCLAGRSWPLLSQGRTAEAVEDARRSLAVARELGYPAGETQGLRVLGLIAYNADGDLGSAVRLARQAEQITQTAAGIPGWLARAVGSLLTLALMEAGDLAAAEPSCRAGLARARDTGDLRNQARMLRHLVILDLQAGRTGDAAAHLREELQIAWRTGALEGVVNGLECCALLCAATRRPAEAVTL